MWTRRIVKIEGRRRRTTSEAVAEGGRATGQLPHDAHLVPVVIELTTAIQADDVVRGRIAHRFPRTIRNGDRAGCGEGLRDAAMAAGQREQLQAFLEHGEGPRSQSGKQRLERECGRPESVGTPAKNANARYD